MDTTSRAGAGDGVWRALSSLACIATSPLDDAARARATALADVVTFFADDDDFLSSPACYEHAFFVVGGEISLRDGIALVRLLKRRSMAGVLAWRTRAPAAVWLDAGADMWLPRSATADDLAAGVRAVQRNGSAAAAWQRETPPAWRLDRSMKRLHSPQGVVIPLSQPDCDVLAAFVAAQGATVPYFVLNAALGHPQSDAGNILHAAMYRLRRRLELATAEHPPLASQAGVGYLFRALILES